MRTSPSLILGIETSCDETAVALVDDQGQVLAHVLRTQIQEHALTGGVVPEVAARAHLQILPQLVRQALTEAQVSLDHVEAFAATAGPGLIGGVMVGTMMAKAMAAARRKPYYAINHLAAHALMPRMGADLPFPYLLLLTSGGHCMLVIVHGPEDFQVLGETMDDAAGECFDKCARMMGLPYPGGPALEALAREGDPTHFSLPRPLMHSKDPDHALKFSFSGLKTAFREQWQKHPDHQADLAAAFQQAVAAIFISRLKNACAVIPPQVRHLVVSGGVASNAFIRQNLEAFAQEKQLTFLAPAPWLCTDNGVMIAWAAHERARAGALGDSLAFAPRPRWPLQRRDHDNG